jgi:hexosaminidase
VDLAQTFDDVVPRPLEVSAADGRVAVDSDAVIAVETGDASLAACLLRDELAAVAGLDIEVRSVDPGASTDGPAVRFVAGEVGLDGWPDALAEEAYRIEVGDGSVTITAPHPAGHGFAVQTLLQAATTTGSDAAGTGAAVSFPEGSVVDAPRFGWRGVMIDIARHFFPVEDLLAVVDLMAAYKLDTLHLHLADDQGWRIEIEAYPALTEVGASTEVGGGEGGFLTRDDYRALVAYAERRGVTVVPEIDMPGHTNAALLSVPELNCDGVAPEPYTGMSVGFSSLCIGDPDVEEFVRTVLTELAEMTPAPYLHVGGDEAHSTTSADYEAFMADTVEVVRGLGKVAVGWEEIGAVADGRDLVVQHWLDEATAEGAVAEGASVLLSPSSVLYFDMAYGEFAPDGNSWAGTTDTREVYDWEPWEALAVDRSALLGVEAPLWTELVETADEIELRLLPRLPALAEVAWSHPDRMGWEGFRDRIRSHLVAWRAAGVGFVDDPGLR